MKTTTYAKVQDRYIYGSYWTIVRNSADEPFTFRVYHHYLEFADELPPKKHRDLVEKGVTYYEALSHLPFHVQTF